MINVYRTAFNINCQETRGMEVFGEVEEFIRDWASTRPPTEAIHDERGEVGNSACFSISVRNSIGWLLEFRLAVSGDRIEAGIDIRQPDDDPIDDGMQAGAPSFLAEIVQRFDCNFQGEPISGEVTHIASDVDLSSVVERILNPDRQIPLAMVTGASTSNAELWQSRLLGLASVATCDAPIEPQLNDRLRPLLCYGGAVRIYIPGFFQGDDRRNHPNWMPYQVRELGAHMWVELREACLSYLSLRTSTVLFDQVSENVRRAEHEELRSRIVLLNSNAQEASASHELLEDIARRELEFSESVRQFLDELAKQERKLEEHEREWQTNLADLKSENDSLRKEIQDLKLENQRLEEAGRRSGVPDSDAQMIPADIRSVVDAVHLAVEKLPNLRFLESAYESARQSAFPRPNEVYEIFEALSDSADALQHSPLGQDLRSWFAERSLHYSPHESDTTMARYGDYRRFNDYQQQEHLEMQAHFRLGGGLGGNNLARIHVHWHEIEKTWIVGHVGRHLPTDQS